MSEQAWSIVILLGAAVVGLVIVAFVLRVAWKIIRGIGSLFGGDAHPDLEPGPDPSAAQASTASPRDVAYSFHTKVVGVTHKNANGTKRQSIIKRCSVGEVLDLVHEPHNPHDENAISVRRRNGERLGYLSRSVAELQHTWMWRGYEFRCRISTLTGGWWKTRGVNLLIERLEPEDAPDASPPKRRRRTQNRPGAVDGV